MTLPTGESPISFSQIRDEFGTVGTDSATAPVRLGQYRRDDPSFTNENVGELTGLPLDTGIPTSGTINVDAFHGKKLNTVVDLHETGSSTFNHNVKTNRFDTGQYDFVGGYRDSLSPSTWQGGKKMIVHINKTFSSNGASNQNDVALTIGTGWPANTEFQIDLGSSAVIAGKGGNGGNGGAGTDDSSSSTGAPGGNGTSALALETGMSINSQASGAQLFGGGGGGGGGAGASQDDSFAFFSDFDEAGGGGGGGGRGIPAGTPGSGGSGGGAGGGTSGSISAGGNGGGGGDDDESEGRDGGAGGGASSVGADGGTTGPGGRNVDGSNGEGGPAGSAIIFF
jgi:hypothetical protein